MNNLCIYELDFVLPISESSLSFNLDFYVGFKLNLLGLQGYKHSPILETHGKDHGFIREKISPLA